MNVKDRIERRKLVIRMRELHQKMEGRNMDNPKFKELRDEYDALVSKLDGLEWDSIVTDLDGGESRELGEVTGRAGIGEIVQATIENRNPTGAARELQEHSNCMGNQIPLAMLRGEQRAVTPAPSNVGRMQSQIIPGVFPQSLGAFLHIPMPAVGVGEQIYPVITQNANVAAPAKAGNVKETTGTFAASNLAPKRLQASFFYNREDNASFAGMDMALRENLSTALSDALDAQIIAGLIANGTALDLTSQKAVYGNFTGLCFGQVDGKFAANAGDIRIALNNDAYALAADTFANTTTTLAPTALDRLMSASGGVRVGANMPETASMTAKQIVRRGMAFDAVAPIWDGVSLIVDEITKADTGQVKITAVMLYNFAVLRSDAFVIPDMKLA